jgi:hypothetical protein
MHISMPISIYNIKNKNKLLTKLFVQQHMCLGTLTFCAPGGGGCLNCIGPALGPILGLGCFEGPLPGNGELPGPLFGPGVGPGCLLFGLYTSDGRVLLLKGTGLDTSGKPVAVLLELLGGAEPLAPP